MFVKKHFDMINKPRRADFTSQEAFYAALDAYNEYLASDQGKPRELSANCILDLATAIPVSPDTIQRWAIMSEEPTAFGVAVFILYKLEWEVNFGKVMELREIIQKHDEV
jgi:hypothetical protein